VAAVGNGFGQSLSIYEDVIGTSYNYVLAVGAPQNSSAYVFFFDANTNAWSQTSQLIGMPDTSFGMSVAAFETIVVVGAPDGNANAGSVSVYKSNTQNEWIEQTTVINYAFRLKLFINIFDNRISVLCCRLVALMVPLGMNSVKVLRSLGLFCLLEAQGLMEQVRLKLNCF
jgi:hypothetical protein